MNGREATWLMATASVLDFKIAIAHGIPSEALAAVAFFSLCLLVLIFPT